MKTLQELLKAHEQKLNELTSPLYSDTTTPEVREILIETCKSAIEQLRRDIEDDENSVSAVDFLLFPASSRRLECRSSTPSAPRSCR